jgi:uncharacterized protein (TIGR00725 family)
MEKVITICGSGLCEESTELYNICFNLGKILAENDFTICSGGYRGIMEASAKGAKSVDGKTIGVIVEGWETKPNIYLDEIVKMPNLMERLTELIALGDGYIILRGGSGTLVELSVILELMNKGLMREKPVIFIDNFWLNLIEILKIDSKRLTELIERNVFFSNINETAFVLLSYFEKQDKSYNYKELKNVKY